MWQNASFYQEQRHAFTSRFRSRPHASKNIAASQNAPAEKEHSIASGQCVLAFVGVHSRLHQGVGPEQGKAFGPGKNAKDAAQKPQEDGHGKTADDHGQHQLGGNNSQRAQQSPQ